VLRERRCPSLVEDARGIALALRTVARDDGGEIVEGRLVLLLDERSLLSLRSGAAKPLDARVVESHEHASDAFAAALHAVLDDYTAVGEGFEAEIEALEGLVFSPKRLYRAERLYTLARDVLRLHRVVAPLAGRLAAIAARDGFAAGLAPLARRARTIELDVECARDVLASALQVHEARANARLAQVNVRQSELSARQNEDMRKISAWVAIIAVPTMIAGIYGMNFEHMPELDWSFGYPLALGVMLVLCVTLHRYFRRIHWL
jgi:magnesium transporter